MLHQRISQRWSELVVVAATGPSLTLEVAEACRGRRVVAVNDAYTLLPQADVLYACDGPWWRHHKGCPDFRGEKWSSHQPRQNDKRAFAEKWGLNLVNGKDGDGFSLDDSVIHYGRNSGFQAANLALLFGGNPVVLVGFDMRVANGMRHFFGSHPKELRNTSNYANWIKEFEKAAKRLPPHIKVINATPGSAIKCFPMMPLAEALNV